MGYRVISRACESGCSLGFVHCVAARGPGGRRSTLFSIFLFFPAILATFVTYALSDALPAALAWQRRLMYGRRDLLERGEEAKLHCGGGLFSNGNVYTPISEWWGLLSIIIGDGSFLLYSA